MGSPDVIRVDDESPQHEVSVAAFFMSKYPITQAQWRFVAALEQVNRALDPDPSRFKGDERPVETVSWKEAVEFCDRISRHTHRHYRLPTEAEWEYSCRAGTTTQFYFGDTLSEKQANYSSEKQANYSEGETTPVGSFPANAFGLYDMHGNVLEWCQDHWHDNYEEAPVDGSAWIEGGDSSTRILRGGSWIDSPRYCRSASRIYIHPGDSYVIIGFRVVCELTS